MALYIEGARDSYIIHMFKGVRVRYCRS